MKRNGQGRGGDLISRQHSVHSFGGRGVQAGRKRVFRIGILLPPVEFMCMFVFCIAVYYYN